ncbi:multidrug transporter [Aliiroseovarius crassostreae]|uniref:Multidrug transporter n=1 Tax=Aliiroseovarius crassostreae TaxID=154981 RepID=A0A0P7I5R8_9RHOB|nr:S49 family peptidase [Aliiroseovarius crassostreae]KPN64592.1 multidrug transporter [Aliiroseovarius crassostreae]
MVKLIPFLKRPPTVAVIRLQGMIASGNRGQLNDVSMAPAIERAFRKGKPSAVALVINSPGGSPVQSSLIAARIRRLAAEKNVPVVAFVEDVAASGGYWLATAADEILVDENSVVGSIGVISAGFGLTGLIEKLGVDRRVYTAGRSKSQLDPFRPENPEDVERLKRLLDDIHVNFKTQVETRRAGKLPEGEDLFTGEIWLGRKAIEKGLVDGIGHLVPAMKARFGDKVRFRVYGVRRGILSRFGLRLMNDAITQIEERAEYARFGL